MTATAPDPGHRRVNKIYKVFALLGLRSSGASLVAQLVKNPTAMWETWVQYLDWEDPLDKGWVDSGSW